VSVALVVLAVVLTGGRIVETLADSEVVISADVRAGSDRLGAGAMPKARAVSVLRASAFRLLVIVAVAGVEQAAHVVAHAIGMDGHSTGVALPVNAVRAAVVPVIVTCPVLILSSDVATCIAREIGRTIRVTLAVVCPVIRTV